MIEIPKELGYYMPGEWEKHSAVWLAWPYDETTFPNLIPDIEKSFCENNVNTNFVVSESSKDVKIFDDVISIKTFSNDGYGGLKVFWASDNQTVNKTINNYKPQHSLLITQIKWGKKEGGLYYVPLSVQNEYFEEYGVEKYLKINSGNNRGISIDKEILISMLNNPKTKKIEIEWTFNEEPINIYDRWIKKII